MEHLSFELPTIFRFATASFGDKRSPGENEDNSQQPEQLPTILLNQIMDNCWKSQQQEIRIREKLFRNNFSWKSDRTSASAFRLCRQCWREENSASMGYCRIFQKIEPPSLREAKSWSVSTFRLRVAHNFPVCYGQFRRQALTEWKWGQLSAAGAVTHNFAEPNYG